MKNTFKKKSLYAAMLVGMGAMGAAGTASAVYVSPDGTGQVLVYPYYTVNGPTGSTSLTAFSVVNSGVSAKVVKVRFRESKNSQEVLDFNLFLSPNDVWAGAVLTDGTGSTVGAKVVTKDLSCTNPPIPTNGQPFSNAVYNGTTTNTQGVDGAGTGLDRTREGYFEILELGNMNNATQVSWVTHGASGTAPANCPAIVAANNAGTVTWAAATNELFGGASILNVTTGMDVTYDATAFADFNTGPSGHVFSTQNLGNESPNFSNGDPSSTVFRSNVAGAGSTAVTSDWTGTTPAASVNAVSATIMHSAVMNEYVLNTDTLSATDWVVTFPTKRYYVQINNSAAGGTGASLVNGTVLPPFQRTFWNGACDDVSINLWDREEFLKTSSQGFSPRTTPTDSLCWEANVVTFNNSNYLASPNSRNINTETRQNGWARISFSNAGAVLRSTGNGAANPPETGAVVHTYTGLPVIGFMVQDYINNQPGINASYGGNFAHKWNTSVTCTPGATPC